MIHLNIEHDSRQWDCRPAEPLVEDIEVWELRLQLREMAETGFNDLDPDMIDGYSPDEVVQTCRDFGWTYEDRPPSMQRLKALIAQREQFEKALLAQAKKSHDCGHAADSPTLEYLLPAADFAQVGDAELTCDGEMIGVGVVSVIDRSTNVPSDELGWRFFVPSCCYWLQARVVCLIGDAIEASRSFFLTLKTEDRRRTLSAILASLRAAAILESIFAAHSTPALSAATSTPQVESAGGWMGLHAPVL